MAKIIQPDVDNRRLRENDIVILVTGLSGSGKSNFINTLLEKKRMTVGKSLSSCTTEIDYEIIDPIPGLNFQDRRLVIVDTPGFNDKHVNDNKILRDIAEWVENSCVKEITGVIYLYDIFQQKYTSLSKVGVTALRALCQGSEDALERVILVTTKWSKLEKSEGETRENELKATFWKDLIGGGSQVKRFDDSPSNAWQIVNVLLNAGRDTGFDVRSRLAKLHKNLGTTKLDASIAKKSPRKRELQKEDIVILVTGLSGSGKSSFINTLLEKERMAVGVSLSSCTTEIDYEIIDPIPGLNFQERRLVIVDTPGLNNKVVSDNKILKDIVEWVENSCVKEITGVVYLYDIFQERHTSISKVDLAALRASFQGSEDALERVILATTKWSKLEKSEGETRENDLKANFWEDLIGGGSQVKRFEDSPDSAWGIVNILLNHVGKDTDLDVRSRLAKLRTNLGTNKKNSTSKDNFVAVLQSIFGMFSRGIADKSRGNAVA